MPRLCRFVLLAALGAALCVTPALSAPTAVTPQLDLSSVTGSPFPSDRWTAPDPTQLTGLHVALPKPNCAARPSDCRDIDVLNGLDGFNIQPRLSIPFSGAIDVASVSSSDVFLVRVDANGGDDESGDDIDRQEAPTVVGIDQIVWDPAGNVLHAESDQLLDQDTTYVLLVTTGVRDASGRPIDAGPFQRILNSGGTNDGALKDYRETLKHAVHDARKALDLGKFEIAAASVFTTQSATAVIEKIRQQLDASAPSPARFDLGPAGTRTVFAFPTITSVVFGRQVTVAGALNNTTAPTAALNLNPGSVATLAFGSFQSPNYETAGGLIPQVGTRTGSPLVQSTSTVAFNLIVPSGPTPAGGWPVAIFGHGFGDNKNNSPFVVASTLARRGIATIAINVVGHGFGPNSTLTVNRAGTAPVTFTAGGRAVDQNGSGTFDSTEGVSAVAPNTIVASRDGLNQTVVDLMALARSLKGGVDVDGNGAADLSTSRIYYYGQSFGGIYGTQLLAADPLVRAGVPNVPGGAIIEIARLSPTFRPLVTASLGGRVPSLLNGGVNGFTESIPLKGEPPVTAPAAGSMPIQEVIDNTEWVSQTSNPVAWAPHIRLAPLDGVPAKSVIIQFARGDKTVPNPTASAIIRAGHLQDRTTLFRNDLAFAVNPLLVPKNPHTFLTNIGVPAVALYAIQAQTQIATFLASDGVTFDDPDLGAPFFETPASFIPEDLAYIP